MQTDTIDRLCNPLRHERVALRNIARDVASRSGVKIHEIRGRNRTFFVSRARQIVMWQAHEAGHSFSQIADYLHRDHTTIIHGIRAVEKRIKEMSECKS